MISVPMRDRRCSCEQQQCRHLLGEFGADVLCTFMGNDLVAHGGQQAGLAKARGVP